jgi:hypothetical protein
MYFPVLEVCFKILAVNKQCHLLYYALSLKRLSGVQSFISRKSTVF